VPKDDCPPSHSTQNWNCTFSGVISVFPRLGSSLSHVRAFDYRVGNDGTRSELLDAMKDCLRDLENTKLISPDDLNLIDQKRILRRKIAELEKENF